MINLGKQVSKLIGWFHGNLGFFFFFSTIGISLGNQYSSNASLEWKIDGWGEKCRSKYGIKSGTSVLLGLISVFSFHLKRIKALRITSHFSHR